MNNRGKEITGIQEDLLEQNKRLRRRIEELLKERIKREALEEALRKSEERLRIIADNMYNWEAWKAPDGKPVYVSPAFERITGYLVEDYMNDPRIIEKIIHPDDLPVYLKHINQEINNSLEILEFDYRILTQNQQQKRLRHHCVPVYDEKGNFVGRRETNYEIGKDTENLHKAIEQIKEQNKFLNDVFESITYPFYVIDANDYSVIKWNRAAGFTQTEGKIYCYRLTHGLNEPCNNAQHPCPLELVKEQKKPVVVEHKHLSNSGEVQLVEIHAHPIFNEKGEVVKIIEHSFDVTELKRAKDSLKEVSAKLKYLIDTVIDAMVIINEKGKVTYWNKAAEEMFNYTKKEIIGKELHKIILPYRYYNDYRKGFDEFLKTGKGKIIGKMIELSAVRKNGQEFPIELSISAIKIKDDWNFIGVIRDITERKILESKLKEDEERFRGLYENSTLGIYRTSTNGEIILANPAFISILGYSSFEEIKNINIKDLYYDLKDRKKLSEIIEKEGIVHAFETRLITKDGYVIDVNVNAKAIRDEKGKVIFYEGVIEDITTRKEAERALINAKEKAEELNRLKSSLLTNISHELRTPLIGITGYAELLLDETDDEPKKQMLEDILLSGKRLTNTVDLIMDLAMLESESFELVKEKLNITEVLEETCLTYEYVARKKGLGFVFEKGKNEIFIEADKRLLSRAVKYVLDNAVKFTKKGSIKVCVSANHNVEIKIIDTGIGIPKDKMDIIFKPFRQVSEGFDRYYEGTGLGLTLARKFIEALGGEVSVESDLSKGTVVSIKLIKTPDARYS